MSAPKTSKPKSTARPGTKPKALALGLSLQVGTGLTASCPDGQWPISRARLRRLVMASLDARTTSAQITLRLVGSAEGRQLNRDFRDKDYATNVLTFDYSGPPELAADIVICLPVIHQEAKAQKKTVDAHLVHMVVHGLLHACGLDHESDEEAEAMEALEVRILSRFRIANPYGTLGAP
ncbi:MAG: rRNA maturation RNase YbeY [Burkholderiaceae bacterium]